MKASDQFGKYQQSPLGHILGGILEAVSVVKKAYPKKGDTAPKNQREHADELLEAVNWALGVVHNDILPRFDEGHKKPVFPNTFSQVGYGIKILKYWDLVSTRESLLFSKIIALLPNMFETAQNQNKKSGRPVYLIVSDLLEEKRKSLIKESSEKIPGKDLNEFFSEIQKVIVNQKLVSYPKNSNYHYQKIADPIFGIGAPYEDGSFSFEHFHPMIFDLSVEIALLILQAPRKFDKLASFLDPSAPGVFFESALATFVPSLVKNIAPDLGLDKVKFEHQENADHAGPTYCYDLSLPDGGTAEVDLDLGYSHHYAYIFSLFLWQITKHRDKFPKDLAVDKAVNQFLQKARAFYFEPANKLLLDSDRAMSTLLQSFVESEEALIRKRFDATSRVEQEFDDLSGMELINALKRELKNEKFREETYNKFISARLKYYRASFRGLITSEHFEVLEGHENVGYDTSYSHEKIPYTILVFEGNETRIVPIQTRLVQTINECLRLLNYDKNRLKILEQKQYEVTEPLFRQKTADCHQWKQTTFEAVENYHKMITSIVVNSKKRVIDSSDVESLKSAIERISSDIKIVQEAEWFAKKSRQEADDKFCLSNSEYKWKNARDYYKQFMEINKSVINQIEKSLSLRLLTEIQATLAEEESKVSKALNVAQEKAKEKVLAEAEYAKNMSSLNSQVLETRLRENENRLKVLEELKNNNNDERKNILAQIKKIEEDFCITEMQDLAVPEMRIAELDETSCALIKEAINIEGVEISSKNLNQEEISPTLINTLNILSQGELAKSARHFMDHPKYLSEYISARILCIGNALVDDHKSDSNASVNEEMGILVSVETILNREGISAVPISELDKLKCLTEKGSESGGFDRLLDMLKLPEEVISKWKAHREQAKKTFIGSPSKTTKRDFLQSLRDSVNQKIKQLEKTRKDFQEKSASMTKSAERLRAIKEMVVENNALKSIAQQRQLLVRNSKNRESLEAEVLTLGTQIEALGPRIELLKKIELTSKAIDEFCLNHHKFSEDSGLYSSLLGLYDELSEISQLNNKFKVLCEKEEHKEVYKDDSGKMDSLHNSMLKKLDEAVEDKFSPEQDFLQKLISNIARFESANRNFSIDDELYSEAIILKNERAELQKCIRRLKSVINEGNLPCHYHKVLGLVEKSFEPLVQKVDEVINTKYNTTVQNFEECLTDFGDRLAKLSAEFNSRDPGNDVLKKVTDLDAEVQDKYKEAKALILHIQKLNDGEKTAGFSLVYDKVTSLKNAVSELKQMSERANLLSSLSEKLSGFLKEHYQQDSSQSNPKVEFLKSLKTTMERCAIEGNCAMILKKIRGGKNTFAGVHLTTLLNQITVAILDFDRNVAKQPESVLADLDVPQRLNALNKTYPQFVNGIRTLRRNIAKMEEGAAQLPEKFEEDRKVIRQLAENLRSDVNSYILSIEDNENPALKYEPFKALFTARLHCQDTVIRKHRPLWVILGSIALAMLSLGTVLIYSKCKTGRFGYFFEDLAPIRSEIVAMEDVVNEPRQFVQV